MLLTVLDEDNGVSAQSKKKENEISIKFFSVMDLIKNVDVWLK